MSELIRAARMVRKQKVAHLMWDDKMGYTLCGIFEDPLGWTVFTFYMPPNVKLCFFCRLAVEAMNEEEASDPRA